MSFIIPVSCKTAYIELMDRIQAFEMFGRGDDHDHIDFIIDILTDARNLHKFVSVEGENAINDRISLINTKLDNKLAVYDPLTRYDINEFMRNRTRFPEIIDELSDVKKSQNELKNIILNISDLVEKSINGIEVSKCVSDIKCEKNSKKKKKTTKRVSEHSNDEMQIESIEAFKIDAVVKESNDYKNTESVPDELYNLLFNFINSQSDSREYTISEISKAVGFELTKNTRGIIKNRLDKLVNNGILKRNQKYTDSNKPISMNPWVYMRVE